MYCRARPSHRAHKQPLWPVAWNDTVRICRIYALDYILFHLPLPLPCMGLLSYDVDEVSQSHKGHREAASHEHRRLDRRRDPS